MSMSQEEIEALMSGAESIELDDTEETSSELTETPQVDFSAESVDDIANDEDINNILAGIDGIVDDGVDEKKVVEKVKKEETPPKKTESIEDLIDANQYPMPVKNENKVVNQLNEVADDSEEKASRIFDVLSFILDENNEIQNYNKNILQFIDSQVVLLEALSKKFPNIDVFAENLESARVLTQTSKNLSSKIDAENNKVFEAMELMQYHDINRQKIERVMAVIKKLNSYLNGIFEDDSDKAEVQIAKHISGDSNEIVDAEDIDALISQFSQEG